MTIPLFKPTIHDDAIAAASAAMKSGWIGMGPQVEAFEKEFAAALGIPADCSAVATNTCTSALHMAMRLLDLPAGSEIITTPTTFVASNQVLLWEKLTPVFADIDPETGNIDPEDAARKITDRTRAITVVHFAGNPCDMAALQATAAKRRIPIVEDAAHACGAAYRGRKLGAHGNITAFSFGATKNLTTGDGGMLVVPNRLLAAARSLRYLGLTKDIYQRLKSDQAHSHVSHHWEYNVPTTGLRYHMNDITAAIGRQQLTHLAAENQKRHELATLYRDLLASIPGLGLLRPTPESDSANYLFPVLAENRDRLADKLMAAGIIVSVHYKPNSLLPIFQNSPLPNAERFYADELSLPMHPFLTPDDVQTVAAAIRHGW